MGPEIGRKKELAPQFRRTLVDYHTKEPAGTIIVDTPNPTSISCSATARRCATGWGGKLACLDSIRRYVAELVALAPDVILAIGAAVTGPLRQATRTVPIVFVNISDPVGAGFVASLRHQTIPSHRPIGRRIGALRDRARCAAKLDIAAGGGPLGGVDLVVVAAN